MSATTLAPEVEATAAESPGEVDRSVEPADPVEAVSDAVDLSFDLIVRLGTPAARRANISVDEIKWERCVCCGHQAEVSHYNLKRRERILLCGTCPPPGPPSASKAPPTE
jgi:hypothetical protein